MSKNAYWYGYLEAGNKSSAVLRDPSLESGSKRTMLLFNLVRNEVIEYTKEIVEPKLRELTAAESELAKALDGAYDSARQRFASARKTLSNIPEKGPARRDSDDSDSDEYEEFEDDEIVADDAMDDEDVEEEA